jgi:hypothetical protein
MGKRWTKPVNIRKGEPTNVVGASQEMVRGLANEKDGERNASAAALVDRRVMKARTLYGKKG